MIKGPKVGIWTNRMSATTSEDQDMFCEKAVALIVDLCLDSSPYLDSDTCKDFLLLLANENPNISSSGKHLGNVFVGGDVGGGCGYVYVCINARA